VSKSLNAVFALVCSALSARAAMAQTAATPPPPDNPKKVETIEVTTQRLDAARNSLSPDTGSTVYRFGAEDIATMPLGAATPLNQVLLQAPGVVQDSFGQLHVRGDHANIQYRINGVTIPEPIAGFGQAFDARFAQSINLITGAIPAQYGYRTAGIVDIRTKNVTENGGSIGYLGGTHSHSQTDGEIHGFKDGFSWYLTGSYLTNDLGIENPTPDRNAIHDHTKQQKSFGVLSYVIDPASRVSFVFGDSNGTFQIPNSPGVDPTYTIAGDNIPASTDLNARQDEKNRFQVLSYQRSLGDSTDFQLSLFHRYTDVHYQPDPVGDITYNGISADILRKNEAAGVQGDLAWHLGDRHTVRTGLFLQQERFNTGNNALVFPADEDGNQTSDVPINIIDNTHITGKLYGVYLQDEWTPARALTVNYGVRFDHVNTVTDEQQLSPRLGLTWDLSPDTRIHAGYARYFTPPATELIDTTSVQLFQGTTNALPSDANTAVKSERANYYDAGISHQLTPHLTVGADAYYRDVRHLQDEGQFGNALIFSTFNYERGKIYGTELSATYRDGAFGAYGNLTFSRAMGKTVETGQFNFDPDELAYIQDNWVHLDHDQTVAASGGVSYKLGQTTLSADAIYGSGLRRGFANSEHLPGYTQVNLGVVHSAMLPTVGRLDLRLAVVNLFDKSYEIRDGSGIGVGAPQWGPRRGVFAGVTKRF
jgi:outer membrane receptor protein involved in Fe transport